MDLNAYRKKRNFKSTSEPKGKVTHTKHSLYIIQKHAASHLHYDFRLELDGTLKSWAVPKGPCLDPSIKRLAVQVEDHPIAYGSFEGTIPQGEYGGGIVMLWDKGEWHCLDENPSKAYQQGHLRIELDAQKLNGRWDLIRFKDQKNWFLIKGKDEFAKPLDEYDVTLEEPNSVVSQASLEEIAQRKVPKKKLNFLDDLSPSPFPKKISPQLATLADNPPNTDEWLHEIKFDGYRMLVFKQGEKVSIQSRNQLDWTASFPNIVQAIAQLPITYVVLDGEVVIQNEQGRTNFQLLQNAIKGEEDALFQYYIFDCLYAEKYNLMQLPLIKRKEILKVILDKSMACLHYSDHILGKGKKVYEHACKLQLEGIVSKEIKSIYVEKRSESWLKVKCLQRQEFVIGGYSQPNGHRKYFGALHLGVYNEQSELVYCGKVGTGFTEKSLQEIYTELKKNQINKNPFIGNDPNLQHAIWVKPILVAEVQFSDWTKDKRLRHASFQGLRWDKNSSLVKKEQAVAIKKFKLTHPEKILYPEDKITKQDLFNYYEAVSEFMLPLVTNRPLTLLRCPDNYETCFYQRHLGPDESQQYIYLTNQDDLFSLIQKNTLEFHAWNCKIEALEKPDLIVFDLDPALDVPWKKVVAAAFDIKQQLEQYKLTSFVKTTGGKGLHVVIPIQPEHDWDIIKQFTHAFAEFMQQKEPEIYISNMSKAKRQGKIFIDYLRNQRTASAICPYSTRARIHAPAAVPLDWDELTHKYEDTFYTIQTLPDRLKDLRDDPWKNIYKVKNKIK